MSISCALRPRRRVLYSGHRIASSLPVQNEFDYKGTFGVTGEHSDIPGEVTLIAGLFMVLMGLNIAGVLGRRGLFEETGITETSAFRNMLRRILALENVWGAFLLGLLLGFLPCGLLYPIFMHAAASGGFIPGMLIMAIFGLSTVPAMMSFGLLMTRLRPHLKKALTRAAAVLIVLLGLRTFLRGMAFNGWIPMGTFW